MLLVRLLHLAALVSLAALLLRAIRLDPLVLVVQVDRLHLDRLLDPVDRLDQAGQAGLCRHHQSATQPR